MHPSFVLLFIAFLLATTTEATPIRKPRIDLELPSPGSIHRVIDTKGLNVAQISRLKYNYRELRTNTVSPDCSLRSLV